MSEAWTGVGMVFHTAPLWLVSTGALLFIFLDYHERRNIHKAILFLAMVVVSLWFLAQAPNGLLLCLALAAPILLFVLVAVSRKR